jgi:hypothetical protein
MAKRPKITKGQRAEYVYPVEPRDDRCDACDAEAKHLRTGESRTWVLCLKCGEEYRFLTEDEKEERDNETRNAEAFARYESALDMREQDQIDWMRDERMERAS